MKIKPRSAMSGGDACRVERRNEAIRGTTSCIQCCGGPLVASKSPRCELGILIRACADCSALRDLLVEKIFGDVMVNECTDEMMTNTFLTLSEYA